MPRAWVWDGSLPGGGLAPLTWRPLRSIEGWSAWLACPQGHNANLLDHAIHPDGRVEPSVVCYLCDWHAEIRLLDWPPGEPRKPP